jgi:hypothetical protein
MAGDVGFPCARIFCTGSLSLGGRKRRIEGSKIMDGCSGPDSSSSCLQEDRCVAGRGLQKMVVMIVEIVFFF